MNLSLFPGGKGESASAARRGFVCLPDPSFLPLCSACRAQRPPRRRPPSKRSTSPGLLAAPITHRRTARTGSLVRTCHRYDIERGVSSDDAIASRILRRRRGMPRRRLHRGPVPVHYNLRIINTVHAWRRFSPHPRLISFFLRLFMRFLGETFFSGEM